GLTINHPVEFGVSQDELHVFAGFRERNGLDEFGNLFVVALGFPGSDAVLARIVCSSGRFGGSELLDEVGDIHHAELDIVVGIERKSTRLNSSHRTISYAVFCLKKKK